MIIQVRGTHGSGKTTTVREVMKRFECKPHSIEGRKRPIGYECVYKTGKPGKDDVYLWVPGSYENATGGCDTISEIEVIYGIVKQQAEAGFHVLFEGILAQHSAPRVLELVDVHHYLGIVLTTPLELCVERTNQRRAERGKEKLEDDSNIRKEWKSVRSSMDTLRRKGANVVEMDVASAVARILQELGVPFGAD